MALAIIGIGVPGSGKTTFLKRLSETYGLAYINKDDIRAELLGDVNEQSKNRAIWIESDKRITEALESGKGVVLDATHAERWKRVALITSLRQRGALRIVGAYFDIPLEQAKRQNRIRERVVDERTMEWFAEALRRQPPELKEGYDVLYRNDELPRLEAEVRVSS